ncbi:MAG: type I 3-dehydroquinate dehydratase [Prevotellaceae bacterium]|jgi:3-dehydroquinate dehydratase-1|nr:type I 3-dehydroquinate dehydratase [Prevotellaceae bacterium]
MLCVSIPSLPLPQVMRIIENADMAELRLDLLRPAPDALPTLFSPHGKKIIATCRQGYYDDNARLEILKAAIDAGCGYIDLEIEAPCTFLDLLIKHAKARDCKVILSYHNFEATPDKETLELTVIEALACEADMVKIATMVHTEQDAARLLALYAHHKQLVAFGMGEKGKITRLASLFLGAPFTYVSVDGATATAPGQFSESEMRALLGKI